MPRRSGRIAIQPAPTSETVGIKRPHETTPAGPSKKLASKRSPTASRAGQRTRKQRNPEKSKYFEDRAPDSSTGEGYSDPSEGEASDRLSDYRGSKKKTAGVRSRPDTKKPGKRQTPKQELQETTKGKPNAGRTATQGKGGKELWREGVRTGLGPGKEVFIAGPKARDPGNIPYEDHTIHPNTMLFLKDLKVHNEREWFKRHDADYRASKKDWDTFVDSFTHKLIEKDSTIPELPAKDLVFRIYRDVRFSKDQTPYKPHFSAAWSRTGRKGRYAAYYLHLQPGQCFLAAGLWMPQASDVGLVRQDIDQNPHRIKRVLNDADVRRQFLDNIPSDERKAVKAFVSQNQESALKNKPMGWNANHRDIDLIRLRSYTLGKGLEDDDLLGRDAVDRVAQLVGVLVPFVTYLNSVVMPDPEDEDEDENSDHEGDST